MRCADRVSLTACMRVEACRQAGVCLLHSKGRVVSVNPSASWPRRAVRGGAAQRRRGVIDYSRHWLSSPDVLTALGV